jgi:hypothetical protein
VGHVARTREMRSAYNILVRKPERNEPVGRPKRRWEDDIRMHLRATGLVDWMNLAQVGTSGGCCEDGNEPSGSIKRRGISWLPE